MRPSVVLALAVFLPPLYLLLEQGEEGERGGRGGKLLDRGDENNDGAVAELPQEVDEVCVFGLHRHEHVFLS